jgi:hypothetical protein
MQADDAEMDDEIEKQLEDEARNNIYNDTTLKMEDYVIYKKFCLIFQIKD